MSATHEQITVGELICEGITCYKGTVSLTVLMRDAIEDILLATGLTKPVDTTSGFAKGCLFIDTDVATGTSGLYVNIGTNLSCSFKLVSNA
jgi:hypothetical protein